MPSDRRLRLPIALFLFTLTASITSAQGVGFDRDDFASPLGARGIVAADLNGDGWTDLAVANTQPGTIAVMLNRGAAGGFTLARTVPLTGGPFEIAAADFDKDGRNDLAVANADGNTIDVLLTGAVSATAWNYKAIARHIAPGGPRGVTTADMDADGAPDIIYSSFYQDSVSVLYGTGAGNFSTRGLPAVQVGTRPQGVGAADLNNDGLTDLVVANTGASLLTALYRTASGSYTRRNIAGQQQLNVLTIGDLNGDGWTDVVAASTSRSVLAIYRGAAAGLQYSSSAPTGSSPRGIAHADFNGDGRADLVVANRGASTASILLQQASGVFALADELPSGTGARAAATGDFDRDGKPDFATGNESAGTVTVFRNSPLLARAAYAFSRISLIEGGANIGTSVIVRDMNHNGVPDVVAGNTVTLDGDRARSTLPLPEHTAIKDVAVLDSNRDGHPDVAVLINSYEPETTTSFDGYYLFTGDGAGNFTNAGKVGGLEYSLGIRTADMNRDGWDDLVVASRSGTNVHQSYLYVLINGRTTAGWTVRRTLLTGDVFAMAIGDVTSDGKLDVVLSLQNETSITVEIGNGSGGFSNEAETSIANVPYDIALVDFDRDGFLDFVVTDGPNVHALKGNGQGHYVDKQTFQTTYRPGGPAWADTLIVADLTDDGLPDIVTNYGLMLPATGEGRFGPAEEFEWYWHHGQAADMDSDGDLDLVVSDSYRLDILDNKRTTVNHRPIANAGVDGTWSYAYQFDAEEFYLDPSGSSDADMHRLTYEWRENGKVLGYGVTFWPGRLLPGVHTYELIVRDERGGESRDTVTWTITHFEEIVIYAAWSASHGTWQTVEDATAADGYKLYNPNAAAPKLAAPLANPVNYVDVSFSPDPALEYKLWIRGKADGNNWANDSVFVQFSDAVDAAGNAVYRIGTTSALAVNLEECSGCGLSGWGWEDDGWGAVNRNGVTLRFPNPEWQRIRIQAREDGFSIDQIVLSATSYKTQRPGSAKNDTTILQRTQY